MIDTQILIHMIAGRRPRIQGGAIASVSAKEFLLAYGPESNRARYYVPLALGMHTAGAEFARLDRPKDHPSHRRATDRIIIDLKSDHPSIVEFSDRALAVAINQRRPALFDAGINALAKSEQRNLKDRFAFLVACDFRCFALEREAVELGLTILDKFLAHHTPKNNFRNTVRDALILGTAVKHKTSFRTEDKLLARTGAEIFDGKLTVQGADLAIGFGNSVSGGGDQRNESKGYIHRGWRIAADIRRAPK
jgi:predicted nucleic acid-binding protein